MFTVNKKVVLILTILIIGCSGVKRTLTEPLRIRVIEQTEGSNRTIKHLIYERLVNELLNQDKRSLTIQNGNDSILVDFQIVYEVIEHKMKDIDGPRNVLSVSMKIVNPRDNSICAMAIEKKEKKAAMEVIAEKLAKKMALRIVDELRKVR